MFSSVFCTDSPCQHETCFLGWSSAHNCFGYIRACQWERIPTQPIGWLSNPSTPTSYFYLLLEFRLLLDTDEELWPLSCYGPRREQEKCNVLLHLFSIDSAPFFFRKLLLKICIHLVVLWSVRLKSFMFSGIYQV